jgi:hypothetical protein
VRRIAGYVFAPQRLALETYGGEEIEIRNDPRGAFAGHANETSWDQFHAAYFCGYALWTYLTQPFLHSIAGYKCPKRIQFRDALPFSGAGVGFCRVFALFIRQSELAVQIRKPDVWLD